MPGEELTLMLVALEHFAYRRKDLWVFFQSCGFSFSHTAPWLPCESDKLKSDKEPGPQNFADFFLSIAEMLAKGNPSGSSFSPV